LGEGIQISACDLTDHKAVSKVLHEIRPTRVFHLSGTFANDFDIDYAGNVTTTRNLLDAVRRLETNKCRVLIVGSAAEYGRVDEGEESVPESYALRPMGIYGLTKVFQTSLAQFYVRVHGLDVVIVRPFNLIGPGISNRLFVGKLHEQILAVRRGESPGVELGDLSGARDFVDVTDALAGYIIALERGSSGEVYNVGTGKLTSIEYLVRLFLARYGMDRHAIRTHTARRQPSDASPPFCADTAKLRQLGWSPKMDIPTSVQMFDVQTNSAAN